MLGKENLHVAAETLCFDRFYPWGVFKNVASVSLLSVYKSFPRNTKILKSCHAAYIML